VVPRRLCRERPGLSGSCNAPLSALDVVLVGLLDGREPSGFGLGGNAPDATDVHFPWRSAAALQLIICRD
jgi:hypothetical protein